MKNQSKTLSDGTIFLFSIAVLNVLNLAFNAYLGRALTFEDFALITLFNSFSYLLAVVLNALAATMNHRSAILVGQYRLHTGLEFLYAMKKRMIILSVTFSVLWMLLMPLTQWFFHVNAVLPLLFTPVVLLSFILYANYGFLQGTFHFKGLSVIVLTEGITKLFFAWIIVRVGLHSWAYVAIPLSVIVAFVMSVLLLPKPTQQIDTAKTYTFPRTFFVGAVIAGLASMAFLTFDVLLAKHFLSVREAGQYALLSLIGKMTYFFGVLPNMFTIAIVGQSSGRNSDLRRNFSILMSLTAVFVICAFVGLGVFGWFIIPLIFGVKSYAILPYLSIYTGAISLFALSSVITTFHLARQRYIFPIVAIVLALIMGLGISVFHADIGQFALVILYMSMVSLIVNIILHVIESKKLLAFKVGLPS